MTRKPNLLSVHLAPQRVPPILLRYSTWHFGGGGHGNGRPRNASTTHGMLRSRADVHLRATWFRSASVIGSSTPVLPSAQFESAGCASRM